MTFKLTIAYDGTGLVGWQRQASGISVQGLVEDALSALDGRHVDVAGAGRTDAGVHALGQVASCRVDRDIEPDGVLRAVNARLPPAVRVLQVVVAPDTFHARFDAVSKTYRYRIWSGMIMSPFERSFAWHVPMRLDVDAMAAAAQCLLGRHDFSAFQTIGTEMATAERTVAASLVTMAAESASGVETPAVITYEITGDGFLRHMVRAIVGSLVDVGRGRRPPEWMAEVLASRDRGRAGQTAPAAGLFLVGVNYARSGPAAGNRTPG